MSKNEATKDDGKMNVILILLILAMIVMRGLTKYLERKTEAIRKDTKEIDKSISDLRGGNHKG